MPHAERTITINRSPDDVFAFFADPAKDRSWRPHVKEIAARGPGGCRGEDPPGGGRPGRSRDRRRHRGHRLRAGSPLRVPGRRRPGPAHRASSGSPRAGTGTEVSFSLSAELGGLKKLFMSGPVQSSMDGEMRALDTAKALLEGG